MAMEIGPVTAYRAALEEEESADEVVQRLKQTGDSKDELSALDREMGARVFHPPATTKEGGAE